MTLPTTWLRLQILSKKQNRTGDKGQPWWSKHKDGPQEKGHDDEKSPGGGRERELERKVRMITWSRRLGARLDQANVWTASTQQQTDHSSAQPNSNSLPSQTGLESSLGLGLGLRVRVRPWPQRERSRCTKDSMYQGTAGNLILQQYIQHLNSNYRLKKNSCNNFQSSLSLFAPRNMFSFLTAKDMQHFACCQLSAASGISQASHALQDLFFSLMTSLTSGIHQQIGGITAETTLAIVCPMLHGATLKKVAQTMGNVDSMWTTTPWKMSSN